MAPIRTRDEFMNGLRSRDPGGASHRLEHTQALPDRGGAWMREDYVDEILKGIEVPGGPLHRLGGA